MLTLLQVFLTTPMFNFLDDTKPLLTKRGIPLGIYWGATVLGFVILLVGLFLLHNPDVICELIDALIPLKSIQDGPFYQDCKKRSLKLKTKADRKNGIEDRAAMQEEKSADKNKAKPGEQSHKANGMNGKSTSTDGGSQRGSKSSTGWFRNGRVALRGDSHV
jgi:hypothetical protein